MGLRAVIVTILLGATVALNSGSLRDLERATPRFLMAVIAATYALTLVYAVAYRRAGQRPWFAGVQIGSDILAWTAVVYATGGTDSGFTFLYGVQITIAAILLGRRAALLTAAGAAGAYALLVCLATFGAIAPLPDQLQRLTGIGSPETAFSALLNVTSILLVANLSGYLAERLQRAGGALRAAERRTADLAARHEDIVRSLESGLVTVDTSAIVRSANPMALEILGRADVDVVGHPLGDVLPMLANLGEGTVRGEASYERADGAEIPLGFTVSPLIDSGGTEAGHLVLFQDLSERQRLRREVEAAERFAALGRLAAGLAHEIRNPLGSISGSVEMLKESGALSTEDRKLAEIVLRETARLGGLVTDILLFARPRAPAPKTTAVGRLLREVVEMFRRGPSGERVQVRASIDDEIQARIDPDQIRQVAWNLLKNAAEASAAGGEVVIHSARARDGDLTIEVTDKGRGIPEAIRARIFDPFFSSRPEGLGIGLALVNQIVQAHGGTIEIESAPGAGTTIRVIVPDARASAPPVAV
ncbi:MAG: PAS domain-containing protein [Deltaproteobacteria bacterium]|nr:PAS domain-containing protein [Deltaproteobacteria bacterium]